MSCKNDIIEFYNLFLINYNMNSPQSVGWSTIEAQNKRFEILYNIGITSNDTILDFGCGLGHFVDYLKTYDYPIKNYTGLDINPNSIELAKIRNNDAFFINAKLSDLNHSFDFVLASGTFTVKMSQNEVMSLIRLCFNICNKGIAFNFLTKDFLDDKDINSYIPEEFYKLIKSEYNNCKMITDYLGNEDFTIYIYK